MSSFGLVFGRFWCKISGRDGEISDWLAGLRNGGLEDEMIKPTPIHSTNNTLPSPPLPHLPSHHTPPPPPLPAP